MIRYALLVCTWVLVLLLNVYLWLKDDASPNIWLWVILAILALVPVAERLKVGNWFEFRKKVNEASKEVSSGQERVVNISNYNISLASEDLARAFSEAIQSKTKIEYPDKDVVGEISRTEDEGIPTIEVISSANMKRLFFVSAADRAIAAILPLLQTLYSTIIAKRNDRLARYEDFNKDVLSIIEEVIKYAPDVYTFEDSDKRFEELLSPVKELIILRNEVSDKKAEPPSIEEGQKLLETAGKATAYLTGVVSTGLSMLVRGFILNAINIRRHKRNRTAKQ